MVLPTRPRGFHWRQITRLQYNLDGARPPIHGAAQRQQSRRSGEIIVALRRHWAERLAARTSPLCSLLWTLRRSKRLPGLLVVVSRPWPIEAVHGPLEQ
jgi:hypothetical protein